MFSHIFKSKRQRELERDIAIQRALGMHRQHINKLQQHERQYMEKSLRARKSGDKLNFSRLCGMVAQTMNERRAIESQLLHFETILQTRDKARLFGEFAGGMKAMARSIGEVFRELNTKEMLTDVETALAQSTQLEATMDLVLDRISSSGLAQPSGEGVSAADIERIVSEQAVAEESGGAAIDKDIEAGLSAIERELTGEK